MFKIFPYQYAPYLSARFFDGISSGLFMMALPWLILQNENMGSFVALIALTCTATSFSLTPFISTLIDRHSRKQILLIVQIIQASTALLVALLFAMGVGSIWILAAAKFIFWISSNLAWLTNNAFTQEHFEPHEYPKISGYQEIIMQVTTLGAGALGVMLLEIWSVSQFALFAGFASTLSALCYLYTPYRRQLREPRKNEPFTKQVKEIRSIFSSNRTLFAMLMLSSLSYPLLTLLGNLIPIVFSERGIEGQWYAGYNMAFGLGSLLTGIALTKLLKLASYLNIIRISLLLVSLALLGISLFNQPIWILVFTLVFGFFNALNRIARTNWMHRRILIEQRGRVDGGIAMFTTVAQSLFYVIVVILSHYQNTELGFYIAAAVGLSATIGVIILQKHYQKGDKGVAPIAHSS